MGKAIAKVSLRNYNRDGETLEVEAVADTGAAYMCLPPQLIAELGLKPAGKRRVLTANGRSERRMFRGCEIKILGRDVAMEVMENDQLTPPLIGYLVLEALDLVANTSKRVVEPSSGNEDQWFVDLYLAS